MTTDNATIAFDSSTDALFRIWGSRISQALAAVGLVQTADTGQINWTTVTRVAALSASEQISGYEIWRFADALQATKPVFIKVEYGVVVHINANNGSFGVDAPVIYVTVGTATNGAGTLTGLLISSRTRFVGQIPYSVNQVGVTANSNLATSSTPMHACGDGSSITMVLGATAAAQPTWNAYTGSTPLHSCFPAMLSIERSRNSDGTPNGDGVIFLTNKWLMSSGTPNSNVPNAPIPSFQVISFTGGGMTVTGQDGYIPFAIPGSGFGTANFGGDIYYFPLPVSTPKPQAQALNLLGTWKNDVPLLSPQVITVLGTPHTYISLAGIAGTANSDNARSAFWTGIPNGAMMMRYE